MHDRFAAGDRSDDGVQRGDVALRCSIADAPSSASVSRTSAATSCPAIDEPSRERAAEKSAGTGQQYRRTIHFPVPTHAFYSPLRRSHVASRVSWSVATMWVIVLAAVSRGDERARAPRRSLRGVSVRRLLPLAIPEQWQARRRARSLSARSRLQRSRRSAGPGPLARRDARRRLCDRRVELQPARLGVVHRDRRQPRLARPFQADRRRAGRSRCRSGGSTGRTVALKLAGAPGFPPVRGAYCVVSRGRRRASGTPRSIASRFRCCMQGRGRGQFPEATRRAVGARSRRRFRTIFGDLHDQSLICRSCCR